MADDFRPTWDDIAAHWDDWGPPLRPSPEDLRIAQASLARWHHRNPVSTMNVFLCGVTPEIATMAWPCAVQLTAMDRAEGMVKKVWPGDIPGVREAAVGNWLEPGLPPGSQHVVIGDGGFGFFDYPAGQRALALGLRRLLQPEGLFVYRHYAQAMRRERLADVVDAARHGHIASFHTFKWRVAMALQRDSRQGVRLDDIWRACTEAALDSSELPQPGWSQTATSTIRFYRGRDARLYFPTLDEFRDVLKDAFQDIEVEFPTYELGERCPILTARPR